MVKKRLSRIILALAMPALLFAYGCASKQTVKPAPGPLVKAGLNAVMPLVVDGRSWPRQRGKNPSPNVRIFAREITDTLRKGLTRTSLFSRLIRPNGGGSSGLEYQLRIKVTSFKVARLSNSPWIVAHMLVDGLLLPAYAGVALASAGKVDLGGYLIPSNRVGTELALDLELYDTSLKAAIIKRSYKVEQEAGSMSDRTFIDQRTKMSRRVGRLTLAKMVQEISRDPHFDFIVDFRTLALAEAAAKKKGGLVDAAKSVLPLLRRIPWSNKEAKVLLDTVLTPARKAAVLNEIRAKQLGFKKPSELPVARRFTAKMVAGLFNDPAVRVGVVKENIAARAISLCVAALTSGPGAGDPELAQGLLARIKGNYRLQAVLLSEADTAVGKKWPAMSALLVQLGSAPAKLYLAKRGVK